MLIISDGIQPSQEGVGHMWRLSSLLSVLAAACWSKYQGARPCGLYTGSLGRSAAKSHTRGSTSMSFVIPSQVLACFTRPPMAARQKLQVPGGSAPLSRNSSKKLTRSGSKLGKASKSSSRLPQEPALPGGWQTSTDRFWVVFLGRFWFDPFPG